MKKSAADRILMILKMRGEISVAVLATELGITKEGVRLHLLKLAEDDLVKTNFKSEGVGRPLAYYSLSVKGLSKFPDTHAQITVELLQSVKKLLGDNALDLLISERENQVYGRYEKEIKSAQTIEERLERLSQIRSKEGYMAEWKKEKCGEYFLIENHCPICAAATECQGFCRSELKNFKQLIGSKFEVERVQHIVSGGQRCMYRITELV
ncbi:helix-turn-helix transcriptional regulator [Sphingobacterium daejeonense]|uniref:helix-turn-helix transcriptional regulator n=1 Tax=Sphingobacterium daejeonense TaxID=371142 RepID=UPI0010C3C3AB|nr:metalloregulator ArsR/SmtB family transcription factor [Sphingobacterium daejeonense]VTP91516.1 iron-sulfur cluster biosynthesis transcriptional regulator SufR [Sphingobacterium daejeonense]